MHQTHTLGEIDSSIDFHGLGWVGILFWVLGWNGFTLIYIKKIYIYIYIYFFTLIFLNYFKYGYPLELDPLDTAIQANLKTNLLDVGDGWQWVSASNNRDQ